MSAGARVVITRALAGDPVARLRAGGVGDVWIYPEDQPIPRPELLAAVRCAHAIIATPADVHIDDEVFDAAGEQLAVVSNYAVGVDNVDLAAAHRRGIRIGHTPHAVTEPTADVAWLLILGVARRANEAAALVRSGAWRGVAPTQLLGRRLVGRTLLIVGAGRIGEATARRAIGWEMSVLYHARSHHPEFETPPISAERCTLHDGLARADVVSIHTPLTADTHHLIGPAELAAMKRTAFLINTARGPVVDETALLDALESGAIAGAGLDVYEHEPRIDPRLAALPNAYLLPHLGTATIEDRTWMMEVAVDNTLAALRGQPMPHAIEPPETSTTRT